MKESKFAGSLTVKAFQNAVRHPSKATLTEAAISSGALFLIGLAAEGAWCGIQKIVKSLKSKKNED